MSPESKAKDLYSQAVIDLNVDGEIAKQFVILLIDEIIEELKLLPVDQFYKRILFWQEVKNITKKINTL